MPAYVTRVNQRGIPAIKSIGTSLSTDRLTITFANHPNVSDYFQGFFVAYINNLPDTSGSELPVYLNTEGFLGSDKQLYSSRSIAIKAEEVLEGVYLCFYDSTTGKVRVML